MVQLNKTICVFVLNDSGVVSNSLKDIFIKNKITRTVLASIDLLAEYVYQIIGLKSNDEAVKKEFINDVSKIIRKVNKTKLVDVLFNNFIESNDFYPFDAVIITGNIYDCDIDFVKETLPLYSVYVVDCDSLNKENIDESLNSFFDYILSMEDKK